MESPSPEKSQRRVGLTTAGIIVAAYGIAYAGFKTWYGMHSHNALWSFLGRVFSTEQLRVSQLLWTFTDTLGVAYGVALFAATILAPLGFLVRMVARAHVRAGNADPLDRTRRWIDRHPHSTRVLLALPALAWGAVVTTRYHGAYFGFFPLVVVPAILGGIGHFFLARAGLRMLFAKTLSDAEGKGSPAASENEIRFDAVAVTRETRATVGTVAFMSLAMVVAASVLPIATLMHDPRFFGAVFSYVLLVGAGTAFFRSASRVAIGLDGVLVYGTSRTRFFAYRTLDQARVRGGDLEILRGGRIVLRLQLHGEDAARRDAVLARLRESIARADQEKSDATADYVASASAAQLARAADGAGDYRQAAVSREQLWAVVEGPAIDSETRKAAAGALAASCDANERARLRVAAEHCAEPAVRIALHELLEMEVPLEDIETSPKLRAFSLATEKH